MSNKAGESLIFHKKAGLREQLPKVAKEIQAEHTCSNVIARILAARGYQAGNTLHHFLNPTLKESLPEPENLKNLFSAAELISESIKKQQSIGICCDFDVDGLTGASQVKSFFDQINVHSKIYVPDRFTEGYGLNKKMIHAVVEDKHKLLIAIDYGTTNHQELKFAREQGLKTIVIDHHHVADAPPADIFINPQQSDCNFADGILCSAGLSWYLLIALRKTISAAKTIDVRRYLDLACLGTICDMVPLIGANRVIAEKGLQCLSSSKRKGIQALKNHIGVNNEVNSYHVGFGFGPRINAAGRMESGELVAELLTTDDSSKAEKIANKLNRLNTERQEIEAKMKNKAIEEVNSLTKLPFGLCVWGEDYHTGVIGIVAQRLGETFYRPAIVMGKDGDKFKGSVRGIPGFSVVIALEKLSDYFTKFGGHTGAGGFTLKNNNPEELRQAFKQVCKELLAGVSLVPTALADTEVTLAELDTELCKQIKQLGPFGVGNPAPQILIKHLKVRDVKVLKCKHLKVTFTDGSRYLSGLFWHTVRHPALFQGSVVNIIGKPDINNYNGVESVQLNLQAVTTC